MKNIQRWICMLLVLVTIVCIVPVPPVSAASAEDRLEDADKLVYDFLKQKVADVANGKRTSTEFKLSKSKGIVKFTKEELGVSTISYGYGLTDAASMAFNQKFSEKINFDRIADALLAECPYELFWYDKVNGAQLEWNYKYDSNAITVTDITFQFAVSSDYGYGYYSVDPYRIAEASAAAKNAKAIVAKHADKTDWNKLVAYKDEICRLVDYDHYAASSYYMPYGDPWQLIHVFDKDPDTKVVCEGYAKAFQYLCNLTDFDGDVECYLVDGTMQGGTGAGGHMWNVVKINGGTLMVDVTNCDDGAVGEPDKLFLKAGEKVSGWYAFKCGTETIYYIYDEDQKDLHTDGYLELKPAKTSKKTSIKTQPKTRKVVDGDTVNFSVKAAGTGLKYQWQYSTNGKTWKNCSAAAAKKATFTFTGQTKHNGYYYRCKITNASGSSVYTKVVRLYVLGIASEPASREVKVGNTVKLTVKATGTGLTYQWQYSTNGKTWKNCSSASAKKATFTFEGVAKHNGNYYRCKVSDSAGNVVYTSKVRVSVQSILSQPKTQKVGVGDTVKFTVKAAGTGLKYQWQASTDGKTWKNCTTSTAKKATFTFEGKLRQNGNYYRCKITDAAGNVFYTSKVRAYVLGIEEQPVSKTVTEGKTAKFSVKATGTGLQYRWLFSSNGGKTWKVCTASAAKKATFTFQSKAEHNGNYYRCEITDSAGNIIYTNKVKLKVK